MPAFLELVEKGHKVPQLDLRPDAPVDSEIVQRAYADLIYDGKVRFVDYVVWADRFLCSEEQFEQVWDTLNYAISAIDKWKAKLQPSSSNNSEVTTNNYGPEPGK